MIVIGRFHLFLGHVPDIIPESMRRFDFFFFFLFLSGDVIFWASSVDFLGVIWKMLELELKQVWYWKE